jgi:hypothetical protein
MSASEGDDMSTILHGKINGRTIELDEDPGLAPGEEVEVRINVIQPPEKWGEGILRCAGALADEWTEEDDRILEEIHQDRKRPSRREIPE